MSLKNKIKIFFDGFLKAFSLGFPVEKTHDYYGNKLTGNPAVDDSNALAGDWNMVGKDINEALKKYEFEQLQNKNNQ